MKIKTLTLLTTTILLLINFGILQAQSTIGPITTKVIPPSPEAQSFMRYGEIPVDPSTGVPNITIPLYQITSGKLSLPISISYHSSGIRVSDVASVVGLGWRLSAGGLVTKTVLGQPDNSPTYGMFGYPYLTKSQIDALPQNGSEWLRLKMISEGTMDGESDRYYYSAGDKVSGEFVYDHSFNIVEASYSDNKIVSTSATAYKAVSEDGTQYFFEKPEYSKINLDPQYVSSWWLTKIVSADNVDQITFEYQTQSSPTVSFAQSQSLTTSTPGAAISFGGVQTNTYQVVLTKITFKNGYITFGYLSDRKDLQSNRLSAVSIYTAGATSPLRKYQFSQSYFYAGVEDNKYNYRMKLDQLSVYDAASNNVQNYSFDYDQDHTMPPYTQDLNYNNPACYGQDFYGYYNGVTTNDHLIAGLSSPYSSINRNANYDYTKTCILKKITYPTGGSTSFEYQLNDGGGGFYSMQAGLRIHRIISKTDASTTATIKRYEYANNLLQLDLDVYGWNHYDWEPIVVAGNCGSFYGNYTTYVANPVLPFVNLHGSPAVYQFVDEYQDDAISNINLKTSYAYSADNDVITSVTSQRYQNQYYIESPWKKGQLQGVSYYKNNSSSYVLKKSISYSYTDYRMNTVIAGTKIERIHPVINQGCSNFVDQYASGSTYQSYFTYFDTQIQIGIRKPTTVYTTEYDDNNNGFTTTENTAFASSYHLFPTSKSQSGSNGETWKTDITYPRDYSGTLVYDKMVEKNLISAAIEQKNYKIKNSVTTFIDGTKTNYGFWTGAAWTSSATDIIVPHTVETQKSGYSPETRIQYFAYDDQANSKSVGKQNAPKTNYLYSYGGAYPIAQITNADYSTIETLLGGQTSVDNFRNILNPTIAQVNSFLAPLRVVSNLPNAQVASYTYQPLVGMTSTTDAKGLTIYYQYDDFQRLLFIRDKDQNILKAYCYNYAGQTTDCSVVINPPTTPTTIPINFTSDAVDNTGGISRIRFLNGLTVAYDFTPNAKNGSVQVSPGNYDIEITTFGQQYNSATGNGFASLSFTASATQCQNNTGGNIFMFNVDLSSATQGSLNLAVSNCP